MRSCSGVGFDRCQFLLVLLLGVVQIPPQLEVHPETGRHPQELLQPQGGGRRHPTAPSDDLVDPLVGDVNGIGQLALRYSHRLEKFLQEHLSRMSRSAICWYTNHSDNMIARNPCYHKRV